MGKTPDTVLLEARLDAAGADALRTDLLARLETSADLLVDASEVSLIDTPAVHVLLGAARSCETRGKALKLDRPSEPFLEAFQILGLEKEIEHWGNTNV